jgi:hypothetical protein
MQWKMLPGQMAGNLKGTDDQWAKSVHALVRHETVPRSLVHWRCGIEQHIFTYTWLNRTIKLN